MTARLKIALVVFSCLWTALSCAAENYDLHPAATALVDELVVEEGFDRAALTRIFAEAERKDSILEAIARPAEKTKPWYEYRAIFLNDKREKQGVEFYREHRDTLQRAEREFGVPAALIVAVIGVETSYGRNMGSYRVLDALSTLGFDYPPRSEFFTSELKHYLILTRDQGVDPTRMKGSYAGAMGYGQFMPSSYRAYAIDFDGDEIIDIWRNPVDAIGSVANYFKAHGWRSGETVVAQADAAADTPADIFVRSRKDLKPVRTIAQLAAAGVVARQTLNPQALAIAMRFELESGYQFWLGLHNFYVITRYNHSAMYAMSVYQLSQAIAARMAG
ncbi:MAG: lytic murein transglycosylase B [Halioglobus sp.]|nr:lytic murein transglycosylase B [Halioglobus sp.]